MVYFFIIFCVCMHAHVFESPTCIYVSRVKRNLFINITDKILKKNSNWNFTLHIEGKLSFKIVVTHYATCVLANQTTSG